MSDRAGSRAIACGVSTLALLVALGAASSAAAQQTATGEPPETRKPGAAPAAAGKKADSLQLEEIVVTAVSAKTTKFRTAYGITTFNSEKLKQIAPQSAVALFAEVPGVWAESTGGESSGNLYTRGLPSNGGEKFAPLLEDGLPVYQEPEVGFMNADTFFRISDMIKSTEFVRGGPADIFYSNASAGAFNFINRRGTPDWQGELNATYADYDHVKLDGFVSGPITDKLSFVAGGYYRTDNGQRPPGFTADHGGELKTALTYHDEDTTASAYLYHLDDHTIFYTDLPFLNSSADTANIHPMAVPGLSLNTGTLDSADFRHEQLLTGNGPDNVDLGNGIHSRFDTGGFEIKHNLGDGWSVEDRLRYTGGYNDFNGMFDGGTVEGTAVLAPSATNAYYSRMQAAYPTLNRLELVYADSGRVFNPVSQNGNGLVATQGWWHGLIHANNVINEARINKTFDFAGQHEITGGLYFSYAELHTEDNLNFGNLLTDTKSQPNVLDLIGLDAAGNRLGAYTYRGFTSFANYLNNVHDQTATYATFINDNWRITDRLKVDFGVRYDHENIRTNFEDSTTVDLQGSPVAGGSNAIALQSVGSLNGVHSYYNPSFTAVSWTIGADYQFSPNFDAFLRYSEPERLPRTEDGWVAGNRASQLTQGLTSIEGGLKVNFPWVSAFVTLYRDKDNAYPNYSYTINGVTGQQTPILFLATSQSYGVEYELLVNPFRGPFDINFQGTLSKSTFENFDQTYTTIDAFGHSTVTSNNYNGKNIPHIPTVMFEVTPSYHFDLFGHDGALFGSYRYSGARWLDNANTFRLPGYDEINIGGRVQITDHLRFQFNIQNLLNGVGLTEGGCSLCGNVGTQSALGSTANVFSGRPQLPRTFFGTLSYRW